MNQYNNQYRPNRHNKSAGNRRNGQGGFLSILLFYILPFIVFNGLIFFLVTSKPKAELTVLESSDYTTTSFELKLKSMLPPKSITASLDGTALDLTKTGSKTYTAVLHNNGLIDVQLIGFNKMKTVLYEQVSVLDDTAPIMKDKLIEDGIFSFRLEDSQSGVDYSSVTASNDEDPFIVPLSIDRRTGLITFEIKKKKMTISAKDMVGNEFHIAITPKGNSFEEEEMKTEEDEE